MAEIIKGNFPRHRKPRATTTTTASSEVALQFKVTLSHCKPPIWRRILVPGHLSLAKFHDVLQICLGWTDSHLHQFVIGKSTYGRPDYDEGWGIEKILDERRYKLGALGLEVGESFSYEYDFGDSWVHKIKVEKIVPPEENPPRQPVLLAGKRACPPEDVGGPYGFVDFLNTIADPDHEDHEAMLEWLGGEYNPEFLDFDGVNRFLKKIK